MRTIEKSRLRNKKYNNLLYNDKVNKKIVKSIGHCLHCGQNEVITISKKYNRKYSNLSIHHIDGDKTNNIESNLTVLCQKCHKGIAHINIGKKGHIGIIGQMLNPDVIFKSIEGLVRLNEIQ